MIERRDVPATVLGLDVGGTKTALGRYHANGRLERLAVMPSRRGGGPAALHELRDLVYAHITDTDGGLGISVAMPLTRDGVAIDPEGYFGWDGLRLDDEVSPGIATAVRTDAECGARGEAALGAGVSSRSLAYLTVGTGVSSAAIVDGVPIQGAHGLVGLVGYGHAARCNWLGCDVMWPEAVCSGPAIAAAFGRDPLAHDARPWADALDRGDERASAVFTHAAWHLGVLLVEQVLALDPEVVIVGGGLVHAVPRLVDAAAAVLDDRIRPLQHPTRPTVLVGELGTDACWAGAAVAAAAHVFPAPNPDSTEAL